MPPLLRKCRTFRSSRTSWTVGRNFQPGDACRPMVSFSCWMLRHQEDESFDPLGHSCCKGVIYVNEATSGSNFRPAAAIGIVFSTVKCGSYSYCTYICIYEHIESARENKKEHTHTHTQERKRETETMPSDGLGFRAPECP